MARKKIVIIEDNAEIREGFVIILKHNGQYEAISQYGSYEAALKNLHHDSQDAVLMDIKLPESSGIERSVVIKKMLPCCIVITVYEDTEKVFRSLFAGQDGYMIKNAHTDSIAGKINEAFTGGASMSLSNAGMLIQSLQKQSPLSVREAEVLQAVSQGKSATRIANDLFISRETVRSHVKNIYQKLAVNNKAEALKIAGGNKWITSPY